MNIKVGWAKKRELTEVREEEKRFPDVVGPVLKVQLVIFADMYELARYLVEASVDRFTTDVLVEQYRDKPRQIRSCFFDYLSGFIYTAVIDDEDFGRAAHRVGVAAQRPLEKNRAVPVEHDRAD